MARKIREKIKKLATPLLCATVVFASMGATALAAGSGTITGSLDDAKGKVEVTNTSGNSRYCTVYIRVFDNISEEGSVYNQVAYNSGAIGNNGKISTSATITKNVAVGYGNIYEGTASITPVATTLKQRIK